MLTSTLPDKAVFKNVLVWNKLSDSDLGSGDSDDDEEEKAELSDWEKRLEALDSKPKKEVDKTPSEEKPAKKKGFFGRKKK